LPTRQYFTANGTFTVPAGVSTVRVYVAGGGGGGGGWAGSNGGNGGTSSFGSHCSATGGQGGPYSPGSNTTPARGTGFDGDINISGGGAAGGAGGHAASNVGHADDGVAGGLAIKDVSVTPGEEIEVTVGAAGTAGTGSPAGAA